MPSLPIDDENLPLFTVGQVSTMLEIQQAFLRRLDEFGVVQPSRSSGGQRRYTRNEITVVQYVVRLADEGMTLQSIRRVLELEQRIRELEAECDALREALREARVRQAEAPASGSGQGRSRRPGRAGPGQAWPGYAGRALHVRAVEVEVRARRRRATLVLVARAVLGRAVRVLRR